MGGDILYFLHRNLRGVLLAGVIASVTALALLLASAASAAVAN